MREAVGVSVVAALRLLLLGRPFEHRRAGARVRLGLRERIGLVERPRVPPLSELFELFD